MYMWCVCVCVCVCMCICVTKSLYLHRIIHKTILRSVQQKPERSLGTRLVACSSAPPTIVATALTAAPGVLISHAPTPLVPFAAVV